ncbi:MAG: PrgI family protein [Clostridiales bacterium]|nr:PrgI family protein [Clostridiales bacterium]
MAAYISVPRDLSRVKSKVLFNLTKRQLICFGIGAVIGVPAFFLLKQSGNVSFAAMGMMVIMLPMFFLGMYERDGQPLEVIAKQFITAKLIRPKTRPYRTNNYYSLLMRQAEAEMEVHRIVQLSQQKKGGWQRRKAAGESDPA